MAPVQIDRMDLMMKGCTVGNFLIYKWIEQPAKQEVLQETMDLLVKQVIVPFSGLLPPVQIVLTLPDRTDSAKYAGID